MSADSPLSIGRSEVASDDPALRAFIECARELRPAYAGRQAWAGWVGALLVRDRSRVRGVLEAADRFQRASKSAGRVRGVLAMPWAAWLAEAQDPSSVMAAWADIERSAKARGMALKPGERIALGWAVAKAGSSEAARWLERWRTTRALLPFAASGLRGLDRSPLPALAAFQGQDLRRALDRARDLDVELERLGHDDPWQRGEDALSIALRGDLPDLQRAASELQRVKGLGAIERAELAALFAGAPDVASAVLRWGEAQRAIQSLSIKPESPIDRDLLARLVLAEVVGQDERLRLQAVAFSRLVAAERERSDRLVALGLAMVLAFFVSHFLRVCS